MQIWASMILDDDICPPSFNKHPQKFFTNKENFPN